MSWFKVDDGFWGHPKRARCSLAATGLWVVAGSWSAAQLTDGHVPEHMLAMFGARRKEATELVASGLWTETDAGWQFTDWADYQPTREQVEADREAARNRMRRARNGRRILSEQPPEQPSEQTPPFNGSSPEQDANEHGTSPAVRVTPSRPVPSRPVSTSVGTEGGGSVTREQRPPDHCDRHPSGWTDPCAACGTAKRARADWDTTDTRRRKAEDVERRRADNAIRLRAIGACHLCDDQGYRLLKSGDGIGGVCDHVARKPNPLERAKAAIQEAS